MRGVIHLLTHVLASAVLLSLAAAAQGQEWKAPTAMKKLSNGLTVVVSEDHSAPTFGLCISYAIGFRLEPQGRTGFELRYALRLHRVHRVRSHLYARSRTVA